MGGVGRPEASVRAEIHDLAGFPSDWFAYYAPDLDKSEALDQLADQADFLRQQQVVTIGCVAACRVAGASWDSIAHRLGIPKQTAMDRYARHVSGI